MKKSHLLLLPVLLLFTFFEVRAQDYAAAVKINTLGINVEAIRSINEDFNVRLGAAFFGYSSPKISGGKDYSYEAKVKLTSISVLGDWFPFQNGLRISAGMIVNLNKGSINLIPEGSYKVGTDVYDKNNLGTLKAELNFNKAAPYIGLGFGNPAAGESGLGFDISLGTMYQGGPKVDLSADGLLAPSAAADQEATIEKNLSWFTWYPVFAVGLTYKF